MRHIFPYYPLLLTLHSSIHAHHIFKNTRYYQHTRTVYTQIYLMSMSRGRQSGYPSGARKKKYKISKLNTHTHTHIFHQSACSMQLLGSYLELSLAACDLIGYSCHAAEAYHIILSDVHFHPIRFSFVLSGCSNANLFNSAHFHFPM